MILRSRIYVDGRIVDLATRGGLPVGEQVVGSYSWVRMPRWSSNVNPCLSPPPHRLRTCIGSGHKVGKTSSYSFLLDFRSIIPCSVDFFPKLLASCDMDKTSTLDGKEKEKSLS